MDLDAICECGHPLRRHNKATPNRDLVTCHDCTEKLCIVHLGFQTGPAVAELLNA